MLIGALILVLALGFALPSCKKEDDYETRAAKSRLTIEICDEQLAVLETSKQLYPYFKVGEALTNGFNTDLVTALTPYSTTLQGQLEEVRAIHARIKRQLKFRQETDPSR